LNNAPEYREQRHYYWPQPEIPLSVDLQGFSSVQSGGTADAHNDSGLQAIPKRPTFVDATLSMQSGALPDDVI
jgi:hypothetical protein